MELENQDLDRRLDAWAKSHSAASIKHDAPKRILEQISREQVPLTPVSPLPSQGVLVLQVFGYFVAMSTLLTVVLYGMGTHLMTGWPVILMIALFALGGGVFSLFMAAEMVPGQAVRASFSAVLAGLAALVAGGFALVFPWPNSNALALEGPPCALMEAVFTAVAALLFWGFARRGALFPSRRLGSILLGLSVCVALVPLQLQCMYPQAPHLLVWHGGTAALLVLIGGAVAAFRSRAA